MSPRTKPSTCWGGGGGGFGHGYVICIHTYLCTHAYMPTGMYTTPVVCLCRRCQNTCSAEGGTPRGSTINNFQCEKTNVPAEVCVRVTRRNEQWAIAQGTLPDRPSGATGPGMLYSAPPCASPHTHTRDCSRYAPHRAEAALRLAAAALLQLTD